MELTSDTIMKLITSLLNKKWYEIITDISVDYDKTDSDSAVTVYIEFAEGFFDSIAASDGASGISEINFELRSEIRGILKYISPTFVFFRFNTI